MESGFKRRATRLTPGATCLSNPSQLANQIMVTVENPVILPPGRARLLTSPSAIGLPTAPKTMGIFVVACLAARAPRVPPALMMTLTLSATSSAGERESLRVFLPPNENSIRILRPSVYPRSRRPWMNATGPGAPGIDAEEADYRH